MTSRPRAAESFDIDFGGGNKKPPMCVIGHFRTLLSLHLFLEINLSSFSYAITSNVTVDQEVLCPPPLDQQLQALLERRRAQNLLIDCNIRSNYIGKRA